MIKTAQIELRSGRVSASGSWWRRRPRTGGRDGVKRSPTRSLRKPSTSPFQRQDAPPGAAKIPTLVSHKFQAFNTLFEMAAKCETAQQHKIWEIQKIECSLSSHSNLAWGCRRLAHTRTCHARAFAPAGVSNAVKSVLLVRSLPSSRDLPSDAVACRRIPRRSVPPAATRPPPLL